jgi:hypothetical protein
MRNRAFRSAAATLGALAIVAAVAIAVARAQALPRGVIDIVWDQEACAHCRMHIGDPAFAAQVQTVDGRVLDFDDPGCMFRYLAEAKPDVHAIWVHEHVGARWLPCERAAFVHVARSPMGFGLGAVDSVTPGAIGWNDAAREASR